MPIRVLKVYSSLMLVVVSLVQHDSCEQQVFKRRFQVIDGRLDRANRGLVD